MKRVNLSQGLSDNLVLDAARDKNGVVWIATANGLNSFNGFSVKTWHHLTDKVFKTRDIREVKFDNHHNLWLIDVDGKAAIINKHLQIEKIQLAGSTDSVPFRFLLPLSDGRMGLLAGNTFYRQKGSFKNLERVANLPDTIIKKAISYVSVQGNWVYTLSGNGRIIMFDANIGRVIGFWHFSNASASIMLNGGDLLVSTGRNKELFLFDTTTRKIKKTMLPCITLQVKLLKGIFDPWPIRQMEKF